MTTTRTLFLGLMVALAASTAPAHAQNAGNRPRSPNDTLKSVEVSTDHKVTFRIYAPKASEVSVNGDFKGGGKMSKDEQGVWSLTTGPIRPDYYSYTFNVDGVRTADPKNAMIKQGLSNIDSMFFVPGEESEFEAAKDVPHGEIRQAWYRSTTLGEPRRLHVYTPPGYGDGAEKYPVFYLLHGAGDDDSGWSTIGRAGFILDNLIAAGKARPMIVVMPNGSLPRPANFPRITPGTTPSPEARAAMEAIQNRFTDELLKDVTPFIEAHYRALPGVENRALAGLSMGGGQTLRVVTTKPDRFAYVGIWSAGIFGGNAEDWEKRNAAFLDGAKAFNATVKLFSIRVGDGDFALAGTKSLDEILGRHDVKHELTINDGGHTWINWRKYLSEFAPRLFR